MAKVKAIAVGYHQHRRVKVGEIFEMKGVDAKGFYLDKKDKAGKPIKCKWVDSVNSKASGKVDPKLVAQTLSGKAPGVSALSAETPAAPGAEGGKETKEEFPSLLGVGV